VGKPLAVLGAVVAAVIVVGLIAIPIVFSPVTSTPERESPRVVGGQERCATAKEDLKRTMENSPAGKVYGLAIVIMSHPYLVRQIGDSVDCAATVTLNNNQEYQIYYSYTKRGNDYLISYRIP
jgi:hypothetical protein